MTEQAQLPRDLGDGIVLRAATVADVDAVTEMGNTMFFPGAGDFVGRIMTQGFPRGDLSSFVVCEDTATGQVVSSLSLLTIPATYGGVPFTIGHPEFVATLPDYRGRGLVRAQFDAIHERSAARGDLMQVIQGIPNYYRQFGYEYALERSTGVRKGLFADLPQPEAEATPDLLQRPATTDDIPFLLKLMEFERSRYLIRQTLGDAYWRDLIKRSQGENIPRPIASIITTPDGTPIGFLGIATGHGSLNITHYEALPGQAWKLLQPLAFATLLAECSDLLESPAQSFLLNLGTNHPLSDVLATMTHAVPHPASLQWYVRVPDVPAFVQRVAPVLTARLSRSPFAGYTGTLRISFYYRAGLRLDFTAGELTHAGFWHPEYGRPGLNNMANHPADGSDAAFPGLTFIQLLMGYRALGELAYAFPDVQWVDETTRMLLETLFPTAPSFLM